MLWYLRLESSELSLVLYFVLSAFILFFFSFFWLLFCHPQNVGRFLWLLLLFPVFGEVFLLFFCVYVLADVTDKMNKIFTCGPQC